MYLRAAILLIYALSVSPSSIAQSNNVKYDKDSKVIFRPKGKPNLKNKLDTSGYCCLIFDINKLGMPKNIETTYCTHDELALPTKQRIAKFRYSPAIINDEIVKRKDKTRRIGYVRTKGKGKRKRIIPGPNGYLTKKDPKAKIPPPPKRIMASKWLRNHFNNGKPCIDYIS